MSEDLLVTSAEVTHALAVGGLDVAMQVGPSEAGEIAVCIGAVVSEKKNSVAHNVFICVLYANIAVGCSDVLVCVIFETLLGVVGKDDIRCWSL